MADQEDDRDELDLELDVFFNEFDYEFEQEPKSCVGNNFVRDVLNENKSILGENSNEFKLNVFETSTQELSNERTLESFKSAQSASSKCVGSVDEEELRNRAKELDYETIEKVQFQKNVISSCDNFVKTDSKTLDKESSLKRTHRKSVEEDIAMDIDEYGLLESEEEPSCISEKKVKVEECKRGCKKDQEMKTVRHSKAKRKKKDRKLKYLRQKVHTERNIQPTIGRLFKPLTATEEDTAEFLAVQLAERLQEKKGDLVLRTVKILGNKVAMDMFNETRQIQMNGGMMTTDHFRKRTSGGIFFYLMKCKEYATKSQIKEIYAEEREKEKQLLKERRQREKQQEEKEIQDLRELLAKKREVLVRMENRNEVEN